MGYAPPQPFLTPDGRTVQLPPDFAAKFQGFTLATSTVPEGVDPAFVPPQSPAPQSAPLGGDLPAWSQPGPTGYAQWEFPGWNPNASEAEQRAAFEAANMRAPNARGGVGPDGKPIAVSQQDTALAKPPVQPKPGPAPAPKRTTDADLAKGGYSAVLNEQNAALAQQADAVQQGAQADADALSAQGDALAARNAEVDRILADRQKAAAAKMQRIEAATIEADKAAKAYADHKVDRSVDQPVLAGIALLLGAVGSAMKGSGDNPALGVLMQQLDKKVQLQMAERDKLKDVAGQKLGAIDRARVFGDDNIATYNLAMAGEMERAARKIEEIGKRSAVASVQANAAQQVAAIRLKGGEYQAAATNHIIARQDQQEAAKRASAQHAASLAEQRAGRMDRRAEFGMEMRYKYDALDADRQKAIAKAEAEGKNKQADDLRKFGVPGAKLKAGGVPIARDEKTAGQLTAKIHAAGEINDIINEVLSIRDRVGGESAAFNSDDSQRLKMLQDRLNVVAKSGTEGLSSENDMKLLAGTLGAADIASFRSRAAGLEAGRDRTTAALNRELRLNFPDVEPMKFENMYKKTPEQTAEEKQFTTAVKKPQISIESAEADAVKQATDRIKQREGIGWADKVPAKFNDEISAARKQAAAEYKDISPAVKSTIRMYGDAALRGDKKGDEAFRYLRRVAEEGETARIREEALGALQAVGAHSSSPVRDDKGNTVAQQTGSSETESRSATAAREAPAPGQVGEMQRAAPEQLADLAIAGDMNARQELANRMNRAPDQATFAAVRRVISSQGAQ